MMASLMVRNIPEELYVKFKRLADQEHRSLNAEMIAVMDRVTREDEIQRQRLIAWESITRRLEEKQPLGCDVVQMIREDRER